MSEQVFDIDKIMTAFGGDKDIFLSVTETFLNELPEELKKLREFLETKEVDRLRISAHTLKGQAATFYCKTAREVAFELENAARENDLEKASGLLKDVEQSFKELSMALKKTMDEN